MIQGDPHFRKPPCHRHIHNLVLSGRIPLKGGLLTRVINHLITKWEDLPNDDLGVPLLSIVQFLLAWASMRGDGQFRGGRQYIAPVDDALQLSHGNILVHLR